MNAEDNGELPEGWACVALRELVKPSSEKVEPSEQPDATYLSLEHIEPHTGAIIGRGRGSDVNSTKAVFRAGDVLYGKLRPYLNKVVVPDFDGICSTDILVFRQQPWIDARFLRYFLSTPAVVEFANHTSTGVQLPRIGFDSLGTLEMSLPPLAEQRRIVAAVEAVLAKANAARERLNRVPAILKRFRQAVLSAACSGRLTADWRECADGASSLDDVANSVEDHYRRAIHKRGTTATAAELLDLTPPVELPDLPATWVWAPLAVLGSDPFNAVQTGPFGAQLHNDQFVQSGVPVIAVGNLTGIGFTREGLYYITSEKAAALSRYDVQAGDLLFARSGATLGKVCVAPEYVSNWRMTGHILRGRLERSLIIPDLAAFAIWGSTAVRHQILDGVRGITRPGFNTSLLEGIWLPVAPLAEQEEIVRRVGKLFALADVIEARLTDARRMADRLTQAVLAKAFRGELVPTEAALARRENRTYEPAADLLARIRADRDQPAAPTKPARGRKPKGGPS